MKKYISIIIVCFLLGFVIAGNDTEQVNSSNSNSYILYLALSLVFVNPLLKFFFPKLKELELGTVNFLPNLLGLLKKN